MWHMLTPYSLSVRIFVALYFIAGALNIGTVDFCGTHIDMIAVTASFAVYGIAIILTGVELLKIKDVDHLHGYLIFWGINFCAFLFTVLSPPTLQLNFLFLLAPSWGIFNVRIGPVAKFLFPAFCFIEITMIVLYLWRNKKQEKSKE